jgi:hypothetical protein
MKTDDLQQHAAAHLTELALARWRNNHLSRSPTAAQARWLRQAQAGYLAWLQAGGFSQDEPPIENSGIAPLFSAPLRDY